MYSQTLRILRYYCKYIKLFNQLQQQYIITIYNTIARQNNIKNNGLYEKSTKNTINNKQKHKQILQVDIINFTIEIKIEIKIELQSELIINQLFLYQITQISYKILFFDTMDPQKGENKQYTTPELVFDKDGYVQSFDIDTATDEELKQFYHRYGILVFRNAINQQQIARTVDDLWNSTTSYYKNMLNKHIDRNDQKTWNNMRGFQKAFGFVGDTILEEPQIWENRKNHKIYKMFKRSYEASSGHELKQPLICNFDRGSLMLPSKINSDWQTSDIYHFDIDPWSWTGLAKNRHYKYDYDPDKISMLLGEGNYDPNVGYTKLAGVLALSDTNEDSGGFECACGFQNYIKQWCQQNQNHKRIQQDKNLVDNFRKIFVRKGSLMIFSRQLPHNIYQNRSENFRYAQYLRMSPLSALCLNEQLIEARKKLIKMILPKQLDVSDSISKQIFMLEEDYVHSNGEKMGKQQQIMEQKQKQVKIQDQNISSNGWKKCSIN